MEIKSKRFFNWVLELVNVGILEISVKIRANINCFVIGTKKCKIVAQGVSKIRKTGKLEFGTIVMNTTEHCF